MRTQAIVRVFVTLVLFINAVLTASGINPIPFDETAFTEVMTQVLAGLSIVWAWWKDAPITKLAQKKYKSFKDEKARTE